MARRKLYLWVAFFIVLISVEATFVWAEGNGNGNGNSGYGNGNGNNGDGNGNGNSGHGNGNGNSGHGNGNGNSGHGNGNGNGSGDGGNGNGNSGGGIADGSNGNGNGNNGNGSGNGNGDDGIADGSHGNGNGNNGNGNGNGNNGSGNGNGNGNGDDGNGNGKGNGDNGKGDDDHGDDGNGNGNGNDNNGKGNSNGSGNGNGNNGSGNGNGNTGGGNGEGNNGKGNGEGNNDRGNGNGNGNGKNGSGNSNGNGNNGSGNANGKGNGNGNGNTGNGNGNGDGNGNTGNGNGNGDGNGNGNGNNGSGNGNGNGSGNGNGNSNNGNGNGNGNKYDSTTDYDELTPSESGQQRCRCKAPGSCHYKILTCPSQCPQRKPKQNKDSKGCFIDCSTKCEATCMSRKPNCNGYGSLCYDPRFVGADGVVFYFHGSKGGNFAIVSDENFQINAHFIGTRPQGRTRDFTWVQSLSVMFETHTLVIAAKRVSHWDDKVDALMVRWDGESINIPTDGDAEWRTNGEEREVLVERTDNTNNVRVKVTGLVEIHIKVRPIGKEENMVHNYRLPADDAFAHLETQFRFSNLSDLVEGVLGKTYRPDYISPVKLGVAMPTMGGEAKYQTPSLISPRCMACRFHRPSVSASNGFALY